MLQRIPITPDPVAVQLGPLPIHWYGIGYAVGLALAYVVMTREARRRGLDPRVVGDGIVLVTAAGLVGGRAYHVIDQWDRYARDPLAIVLPPYTGLGVLGGIVTATLALLAFLRRRGQPFWPWADVVAAGAFVMQAVARWGNFFNQELYGPPTGLPWGIAIECPNRVPQYPCATYPEATTAFQPLFGYESLGALVGLAVLLFVAGRFGDGAPGRARLRPGDLFLGWLVWYCALRFGLETLRVANWSVGGLPTAMVVTAVLGLGALAVLARRHRRAGTVAPTR